MTAPERPAMSAESAARFRRVVDDSFDVAWRFLRGLGVPSAAVDDAAQQVFLIVARRLDEVAPGSERAFVLATARGVAANARRSAARKREVLDEDALAAQPDLAGSPEDAVSSKEARALLDTFLESLAEDERTVFVLFELEGMTTAAIAESLGIPVGTVASRLRRARDSFQAAVTRFRAKRGSR
jgi:RNA polymerase sigma-70 factor (ECF subfamily)